jgi:hypothetical protein
MCSQTTPSIQILNAAFRYPGGLNTYSRALASYLVPLVGEPKVSVCVWIAPSHNRFATYDVAALANRRQILNFAPNSVSIYFAACSLFIPGKILMILTDTSALNSLRFWLVQRWNITRRI